MKHTSVVDCCLVVEEWEERNSAFSHSVLEISKQLENDFRVRFFSARHVLVVDS